MKDGFLSKIHIKWIWICFLFLVVIGISVFIFLQENREYRDSDLGISIQVPRNWSIEKSDRIAVLTISPIGYNNEAQGSITIFAIADYGDDLLVSLDKEIERIRQISNPNEIEISEEPEKFELNGYDAARVSLLSVTSESNKYNGNYPIDLILIRGDNMEHMISLQVHKSPSSEIVNGQLNQIVNSIKLIHDYDNN